VERRPQLNSATQHFPNSVPHKIPFDHPDLDRKELDEKIAAVNQDLESITVPVYASSSTSSSSSEVDVSVSVPNMFFRQACLQEFKKRKERTESWIQDNAEEFIQRNWRQLSDEERSIWFLLEERFRDSESDTNSYCGWKNWATWQMTVLMDNDFDVNSIKLSCTSYSSFVKKMKENGLKLKIPFDHPDLDRKELDEKIAADFFENQRDHFNQDLESITVPVYASSSTSSSSSEVDISVSVPCMTDPPDNFRHVCLQKLGLLGTEKIDEFLRLFIKIDKFIRDCWRQLSDEKRRCFHEAAATSLPKEEAFTPDSSPVRAATSPSKKQKKRAKQKRAKARKVAEAAKKAYEERKKLPRTPGTILVDTEDIDTSTPVLCLQRAKYRDWQTRGKGAQYLDGIRKLGEVSLEEGVPFTFELIVGDSRYASYGCLVEDSAEFKRIFDAYFEALQVEFESEPESEQSSDSESDTDSGLPELNQMAVSVPSMTDPNVSYDVNVAKGSCTCPDHIYRNRECKHLKALKSSEPQF
jgi:hypothetical protein